MRPGRGMSCAEEHVQASDCRVRCNGIKKQTMPPDLRFKDKTDATAAVAVVPADDSAQAV